MDNWKKFYYDSLHFIIIVMILIGFAFFFVGMIATTLVLELLNRIYVHTLEFENLYIGLNPI